MGGDRRLQVQQPHLHQAPDAAAESQGEQGWALRHPGHPHGHRLPPAAPTRALPRCLGEAGFRGPGHGDAQLHAVLHERCLHGLRPGVQVQRGRERSGERQRLRLARGCAAPWGGSAGRTATKPEPWWCCVPSVGVEPCVLCFFFFMMMLCTVFFRAELRAGAQCGCSSWNKCGALPLPLRCGACGGSRVKAGVVGWKIGAVGAVLHPLFPLKGSTTRLKGFIVSPTRT